jgi:hypothetical protein
VIWLLRGMGQEQLRGMLPHRPAVRDVSITIPGLDPGSFTVHCWDTCAGELMSEHSVHVGPDCVLRFVIPQLGNDLALAVRACAAHP